MSDSRFEAALAAVRADPAIMRQVRDLATTSAMSMDDAAQACAHTIVGLAEPKRIADEELGRVISLINRTPVGGDIATHEWKMRLVERLSGCAHRPTAERPAWARDLS